MNDEQKAVGLTAVIEALESTRTNIEALHAWTDSEWSLYQMLEAELLEAVPQEGLRGWWYVARPLLPPGLKPAHNDASDMSVEDWLDALVFEHGRQGCLSYLTNLIESLKVRERNNLPWPTAFMPVAGSSQTRGGTTWPRH